MILDENHVLRYVHLIATSGYNTFVYQHKCLPVVVTVHGLSVPSSLCCVCVCVQVSVYGCVWLRLIRSSWGSFTGAILDPVLCCQILRFSACVMVSGFRRFLLPWFLISAVSWTLNTGHLAAHCFPALPAPTYGELNLVSSVSPVWRVCNKPFLFPQLESSLFMTVVLRGSFYPCYVVGF